MRRAEAHQLPLSLAHLLSQGVNRLQLAVKRLHRGQQAASLGGGHHALGAPLEQRKSQLLLGMGQHPANIGLRHVKQPGGAANRACLHNRLKNFDMA